jgi:hypothetical protein
MAFSPLPVRAEIQGPETPPVDDASPASTRRSGCLRRLHFDPGCIRVSPLWNDSPGN